MNPKLIPPHWIERLPLEERQRLGVAGFTPEVRAGKDQRRQEDELQKHMASLLDQRGIFFSRARMDKKTTVRVGMFDFTIYLPSGRFLAVEAKAPGGSLSIFQRKVFTEFWEKTGQVVHIVSDFEAFRQLLQDHAT